MNNNETKSLLLDASKLSNATSSPNLSIAHLYYEILNSENLTFSLTLKQMKKLQHNLVNVIIKF